MKPLISIILLALVFFGRAQPVAEEIFYQKLLPSDSAWKAMTDVEKLEYCRFNAESFHQLCGRLPVEMKRDSVSYIYYLNASPDFFGEYHYSKRQQDFINSHTVLIEQRLREDLLERQNSLYNWNYLLLHTPPTAGIVRVLLDDYHWKGSTHSEALSPLIQFMNRANYTHFSWSEPYLQLNSQPSLYRSKIPHTHENGRRVASLARMFADSLQLAAWLQDDVKPAFAEQRVSDDSWSRMTVSDKVYYCLLHTESYRQICYFSPIPAMPDPGRNIYPVNHHLKSFGEYAYSARQLEFLTQHIAAVVSIMEEDLFLNNNNLYYWNFLISQIPAYREVLDRLHEYWRMQPVPDYEPLNLVISLMIRDRFAGFIESGICRRLTTSKNGIPASEANLRKLSELIDEYKKSSHVRYLGHGNRISDSQIFSAITNGDTLYKKTHRISDAKLSSLPALQLLNYCMFNPERYFQLCSNAGSAGRNYRKYIYADWPVGDIDKSSYSERQQKALLIKQDSCQALLMELMHAGDIQEGLIVLTNTWQAIPLLERQHRMYGSRTGSFITTLLALLEQNKGTGFNNYVFEREALTLGNLNAGEIKKTPANENAIIRFAFELYRLKQQRL